MSKIRGCRSLRSTATAQVFQVTWIFWIAMFLCVIIRRRRRYVTNLWSYFGRKMQAEEGPRCIVFIVCQCESFFTSQVCVWCCLDSYLILFLLLKLKVTLHWAWVEFYYLRHLQEASTASFFLDALLRKYFWFCQGSILCPCGHTRSPGCETPGCKNP